MATGYVSGLPVPLVEIQGKLLGVGLQELERAIRDEEARGIAASPLKRYPMEPQSPLDYTPTETIGFKDWSL